MRTTLRSIVFEIGDDGMQSVMSIFERDMPIDDFRKFIRYTKRMTAGSWSSPVGSKRRIQIKIVGNDLVTLHDRVWVVPEKYRG